MAFVPAVDRAGVLPTSVVPVVVVVVLRTLPYALHRLVGTALFPYNSLNSTELMIHKYEIQRA